MIRCPVPPARSKQSSRGVASEQLGIPCVHAQHLQRFVAGWSKTFISFTPRLTAVVIKPDRKLCPPNVTGSKPSWAAAALTPRWAQLVADPLPAEPAC